MHRRMRVLLAFALVTLLSPLPGAGVAIHVLVDHEHGDAPDLDPVAALHGHDHPSGTPAHDHGLLPPSVVSRTAGESVVTAIVVAASLGALSAAFHSAGRCRPPEAVARASPTAHLASILRV